jgi:hypothetical protein
VGANVVVGFDDEHHKSVRVVQVELEEVSLLDMDNSHWIFNMACQPTFLPRRILDKWNLLD